MKMELHVTNNDFCLVLRDFILLFHLIDPVSQALLKDNLDLYLPTWVKIVNKSLSSGNFDGLKHAVVKPLLKEFGLDSDVLKNYRPISNLQFLSKLIERVVLSRLNEHMNNIGCSIPNQYGYKPAHNTESLLIKITNDLLIASDSKTATVLLLLDLSSAFDTVDKMKLLRILSKEIKIRGNALKWFTSYLFGRTQRVKVGNDCSDEIIIEFGVPQGSVLGPVLFNIYIRSLYAEVEDMGFNIKGFADDHQIYTSFTPDFQYNVLKTRLNEVINSITDWMNRFLLKLNPEKSKIIVFGPPEVLDSITLHGMFLKDQCVRFVNNVKNLGFHLDSTMSMDQQVNAVVKRCFMAIRSISGIKHFIGYEQKRMLMSSLVLSQLDYCNSIYMGTHSNNIRKLQSVQNAAARLIMGCRTHRPLPSLLNELHWLPIKNRIIFKICVYVHKCLYHIAPEDLMMMLLPTDSFIRTATLKCDYTPQNSYGSKAFSICAPKAWNSIPYNICYETDLSMFKKLLKTFLFPDLSFELYNSVLHS